MATGFCWATARSSIDPPKPVIVLRLATTIFNLEIFSENLSLTLFWGPSWFSSSWNFPGVACDCEHMTCGLLIVQKQKPGRGKGALSWSKQVSVSQTTASGVDIRHACLCSRQKQRRWHCLVDQGRLSWSSNAGLSVTYNRLWGTHKTRPLVSASK